MDKKIYEALETIKTECENHKRCKDCQLYISGGCVIDLNFDPCEWDIESLMEQEVEDNG